MRRHCFYFIEHMLASTEHVCSELMLLSLFAVLELAEGGELFDKIIEKTRFNEAEAKLHFYQIASAIQYLHHKVTLSKPVLGIRYILVRIRICTSDYWIWLRMCSNFILHALFQSAQDIFEKREGSGAGSGSVPLNIGFGSRRSRNMRIRFRIRIPNTAPNFPR